MQHNNPIVLTEALKELKAATLALDAKQLIQAVKNQSADVNAVIFSSNGGFQTALQFICNALTPRTVQSDEKTNMREVEAIKTLIELRADVNLADTTILKDTPLIYAIDAGHLEAAELLLKNGTQRSINIADHYYGNTPLLIALKRNYPDLALLLINNKADINIADKDGNTPLHYACLYRNTSLINLLLELGAKPDTKNREGITPSDLYIFDFQNLHWIGSDKGQQCSLFQKVEEFFVNLDFRKRPNMDIDISKKLTRDKPAIPSENMLEMGKKLHHNFFRNAFWQQFLHLSGLVAPADNTLLFSFPSLQEHAAFWKIEDSQPTSEEKSREEKRRAEGKKLKEILEKETEKFHSLQHYKAPIKMLHLFIQPNQSDLEPHEEKKASTEVLRYQRRLP